MLVRDKAVSKALSITNVEKFKKDVFLSHEIVPCTVNFETTLKFPSFNQNLMTFQCIN